MSCWVGARFQALHMGTLMTAPRFFPQLFRFLALDLTNVLDEILSSLFQARVGGQTVIRLCNQLVQNVK